jgi:hypothetical protein
MSKKQPKGAVEPKVQLYGPLGPWRLSIAVLVTALTSGSALFRSATTGVGVDMALGRSFGIAFVTWIVLGSINKMLATAEALGPTAGEQLDPEQEPITH